MSTPLEKIMVALTQYTPVELTHEMPSGSVVRTAPSALGTFVGRQLAAIADAAETDRPTAKKRCSDCAYSRGTVPNRTLQTVMDALTCSATGEPFYCHKAGVSPNNDLEPNGVCNGWAVVERSVSK